MTLSLCTTECHLWRLARADGQVMGFTDHDADLLWDGLIYRASSGLSASAVVLSSGLAVDNSEAVGALSDAAIHEADLQAGRYDGAEVRIWRVNWQDLQQSWLLFRGHLGEITRCGTAFRAELRGLAEPLNQVMGRAYGRGCSAVLGDAGCRFALDTAGYVSRRPVEGVDTAAAVLTFAALPGFVPGWFAQGQLVVESGAARGLSALIRRDAVLDGAGRQITLWQGLRADLRPGDQVRLVAGCAKTAEVCRNKFNNILNFQGFPFMPGEDWLMSYPRADRPASGGSLTGGA